MNDTFHFIGKLYKSRKGHITQRRRNLTVYFGWENITVLVPKIRELVPDSLKETKSIVVFKNKIEQQT